MTMNNNNNTDFSADGGLKTFRQTLLQSPLSRKRGLGLLCELFAPIAVPRLDRQTAADNI
jgi:hypothetical protein